MQPPSLILHHCQVLDCLKAIWESGVGGEVRMDRESTGPDTRPVMFGRDAYIKIINRENDTV